MLSLRNPPARICILRLSALGDCTHAVPVVRAIQARWPGTEITWVIGRHGHELLRRLDGVEFIVFDKQGGLASFQRLREQLSERAFDVLLHMQIALRADILSRFISAPVRLGWSWERSPSRHQWFIDHAVDHVPMQHQVPAFLRFAAALGLDAEKPDWRLQVAEEDRAWASRMLPEGDPILMISPCSRHSNRNWSFERLARVADHAASSLGMRVALIGGPSDAEKQAGERIRAAMRENATNLIGKDTASRSMALLEQATVLLSPDSGPAHIASALGTPVVGLYAATWSRRSGPYGSLESCVDRFPEAARKFRGREPEQLRWGTRIKTPQVMDLVTVDDVIGKLEQCLPPR